MLEWWTMKPGPEREAAKAAAPPQLKIVRRLRQGVQLVEVEGRPAYRRGKIRHYFWDEPSEKCAWLAARSHSEPLPDYLTPCRDAAGILCLRSTDQIYLLAEDNPQHFRYVVRLAQKENHVSD